MAPVESLPSRFGQEASNVRLELALIDDSRVRLRDASLPIDEQRHRQAGRQAEFLFKAHRSRRAGLDKE